MQKILAKSDPEVTLEDHSKQVKDLAMYIAKKSNPNIDPNVLNRIGDAAYLHDIGKAEKNFQNYIQNGEKTKDKFYNHQEIGWAFLKKYTNIDDRVLNVIYWHHGVSRRFDINNRESVSTILQDIDITDMQNIYEKYYGKISINSTKAKIPLYYEDEVEDDILAEIMFMRICVISADRLVSSNKSFKQNINEIDNIITRKEYKIDECPFDDDTKFKKQQEIVKKCGVNTLVKAPAGFGKTFLALMWAAITNKKIIWICPRNTIARSVYNSIIDELKRSNNSDVSVELYLTGETKEHNSVKKDFTSDIIVTNIDNYFRPSCDISDSEKLYMVNNCDIIFDEFHEITSEAAMFKLFYLINNMRNDYCTSVRTLFLSATPSLMLDKLKGNITHLPSRTKHYGANKRNNRDKFGKYYGFEVKDVKDINFNEKNNSNLYIFNSIRDAQKYHNSKSIIFHSNFIENVKDNKFKNILTNYGKYSRRLSNKKNLFGTHIIQASLDISFRNLHESVLSPEATLQRVGRCDRWTDYRLHSQITCFTDNNPSNQKVIEVLYEHNLNRKWIECLKTINSKITLDELYTLYNKFNKENAKLIHRYYNEIEEISNNNLSKIYPRKHHKYIRNEDIIDANSNMLRNTGHNIFFIVKNHKTNKWEGPFSCELYDKNKADKQFKESYKTLDRIKKEQMFLISNKLFNFGNKYQIKNRTIDMLRRMAVKSNTPYMRFDVIYDDEKGIMKREQLIKD